jgi:hypothetical protein
MLHSRTGLGRHLVRLSGGSHRDHTKKTAKVAGDEPSPPPARHLASRTHAPARSVREDIPFGNKALNFRRWCSIPAYRIRFLGNWLRVNHVVPDSQRSSFPLVIPPSKAESWVAEMKENMCYVVTSGGSGKDPWARAGN